MRMTIRKLLSLNDPGWGRGQGSGNNSQGQNERPPTPQRGDGPPDLDELWRDFNRKLNGIFKRGGGGNQPPGAGGGDGPGFKGAGTGLGVMGGLAALLWLASGFFIIPEGQSAVVLQFGELKYVKDQAGLTWRLPYPIQAHELVNVQQLRQIEVGYRTNVKHKVLKESLMLTQDQSIVDIQYAVQYRLANPRDWLFNNNPGPVPDEIVRQSAETAMREVVGRKSVDQVLYEEKESVAKDARTLMQAILDRYQSGVNVVDVRIQQAQPPEQVQAAFEDANKAAQDRERLINDGRAYANDVIPRASGTAARVLQEAEGYKARIVETAEGDASRFSQVLTEYARAPQVTRQRLYLETMQQVFTNTSKVYIDARANGNLLYLPLDKLISGQNGDGTPNAAAATGAPSPERVEPVDPRTSRGDGLRSRDRDSR